MRLPPYSVLVSWPEPNYTNPVTRGPANEIIAGSLLALVTFILGIRLYTRLVISHGFGPDDILICLAYLPAVAFAITGIVADHTLGWNRHMWDVRPNLLTAGIQLGLASQALFDAATTLTKLSMLSMLYRLTSAKKSRMRFAVLGMMILVSLSGIIFVTVLIFQCRPVKDYWTLSFQKQDCINESLHLLAAGTINTVTDLVVVILPISTVLSLKLRSRQRIIVIMLFAAGFLATAAGVARTILTWQMSTADDFDITWRAWTVWLSSSVELFVGIICASIPATKPFFSQYLPGLVGNISSMLGGKSCKDSKGANNDLESDSPGNSITRDSKQISIRSPPAPTVKGISLSTLNKPLPVLTFKEIESPISPTSTEEVPRLSSGGVSLASEWSPTGDSPTPLRPPKP